MSIVAERLTVRRDFVTRRVIDVVMAVVAIAAVAKLADVLLFMKHLRSWELIPQSFLLPLALFVPSIELTLASTWFCRLSQRAVLASTLAMLAVFTLAYLGHAAFLEPPTCGCFGDGVALMGDTIPPALEIIGRNVLLIGLLAFGIRSFDST